MAFEYTAKNMQTGQTVAGRVDFDKESAVLEELKKQGLLPITVKELGKAKSGKTQKGQRRRGKVGTKDLVFFTRQLAATMKAGILLTEALDIVSADLRNVYFRDVIIQIRKDITAGSDFKSALKKYPHIFNETYLTIIYSGETSGTLNKTLMDLAKYLEESEEIREKIKTGLTYPVFLIIFTFLIVFSVVVFFIPKFKKIFNEVGQDLPWITRIVTGVSEFLLNHVIHIGVGGILLAGVLSLLMRIEKFKDAVEVMKLKLPLIGRDILHKALVSRFCRTFGMMLEGGITMNVALKTLSDVFENAQFKRAIHQIRERVMSGVTLSDELAKHEDLFPPLVNKMAYIGEKTGRIEEMLLQTAQYYDEQVSQSIKRLLILIEPVMIVFVGIFVCIIVVSIYLPIFNMISVVQF